MNDPLGDRMKAQYEARTRYMLPRRTYTIIRVDGRAFHAYTRGCERPYDAAFAADMDQTAIALCAAIQGAKLAYVQSDEISVLVTDFEKPDTQAWFDGNLSKIVSLSAATATAAFNAARFKRALEAIAWRPEPTLVTDTVLCAERATFDARAFTIPDPVEVHNYMVWRQKDATRNSILMTGQAFLSHKALQGMNTVQIQDALHEKGINWNDQPEGFKRGRCAVLKGEWRTIEWADKKGEAHSTDAWRRAWQIEVPPVFTQDVEWLRRSIPAMPVLEGGEK